jgi:hypothetical protein
MVITRIENHVMTLRLILLQGIAGQLYDNCTIVITSRYYTIDDIAEFAH